MNKLILLILGLIILVGVLVRFLFLDIIPTGINSDEASLGYNAYSILKTGKDEYGKFMPIFFRSSGNFQSPLYVYLSAPFVYLFGLSAFSTKFLSALSGSVLVLITYFFIYNNWERERKKRALIAASVLAICPWSIFFSRMALEANLGLTIFMLGVLLTTISLKKPNLLVLSSVALAFSTYAYHSERIVATLYLFGFLLLFRRQVFQNRRIVLVSVAIFVFIQIPQLFLINTPAFNRRFVEVNYLKDDIYATEGAALKDYGGKWMFITREFTSRYISYFSPKNLFSNLDPKLSGAMPNLSLFYSWMIVPFILGSILLIKRENKHFFKTILLIAVLAPIPAAVTKEAFYAFRVLPLFWVFSVIIGLGCGELLRKVSNLFIYLFKYILLGTIALFSCLAFYVSYAVIHKYEHAENYSYIQLVKISEKNKGIVYSIDSARVPSLYILFAFFRKEEPRVLQEQDRSKEALKGYYSNIMLNDNDVNFENVITRMDWATSPCINGLMVGDILSISAKQAKDHHLTERFTISNIDGKTSLYVYATNPREEGCI